VLRHAVETSRHLSLRTLYAFNCAGGVSVFCAALAFKVGTRFLASGLILLSYEVIEVDSIWVLENVSVLALKGSTGIFGGGAPPGVLTPKR
jgi:hypothetical protein